MHILFVTSEAVPYAKTGGLADVTGALPVYLGKTGCSMSVVMPLYRTAKARADISPDYDELTVAAGSYDYTVRIRTGAGHASPSFYFVECDRLFDRDALYGTADGDYRDNAVRFTVFCKAVLAWCARSSHGPDILHCHDWQTGLIPALKHYLYAGHRELGKCKTVFTIHNLAYQGVFPRDSFDLTGLPDEAFGLDGLEYWGGMNMMKSGIVYADIITTVSKTYSREIQSPEHGWGLDGLMRKMADRLYGILNGVDYNDWNPKTDPYLKARYSEKSIWRKKICKKDLMQRFNLTPGLQNRPLIGVVSRLAEQKGFDLIAGSLDRMLALDVLFVLLGTGDQRYNDFFSDLGRRHPGRAGSMIGYSNEIAHKIEAGADMFLMPSRYEPCGLNQIYSLKYGTVPVVRSTGGLNDTIRDYDPSTGHGTGFGFVEYTSDAMLDAVERAVGLYGSSEKWRALVMNCMGCDYSWEQSALEYKELYVRLTRTGR